MVDPTTVLVVIDQMDTYHMRLLDGVHEVLEAEGLSMVVHAVDPRAVNLPGTFAKIIHSGRLCGVIGTHLASSTAHEQLTDLVVASGQGIPLVHIGSHPKANAWTVLDNGAGMRELLDHLFDEVGVRRPVVLRGIPHQPDSQERESLVRESLARRGLELDPEFLVDGGFARMQAYQGLSQLLRNRRDMDAVIAFNDRSAIGAADALRQFGLRVPEDVVLTGFDDEPVAALLDPPLTSVNQNLRAQGVAAAQLLTERLRGGATEPERLVPTQVVVRASTDRTSERVAGTTPHPLLDATTGDITLAMTREFLDCESVEELTDVLAGYLPRLGVSRCLMVLLATGDSGAGPGVGRLVLDFDADADHDHRTDERFPLDDLFPARYYDELARRNMVMQPLSVGDAHYGYAIFDAGGGTFSGENLQLDLSRALAAIESKRRLAEYAEELERRVARRTEQLEAEIAARRRTELELVRANAELRKSVFIDGLTRIANRTALDESLATHWREHEGSDHMLSLILVDVDHFKPYNDHYGHLRGDDVLRCVAACLTEAVRGRDDLASRYGGEEFAVVLPQTDEAGAAVVAERIRRLVKEAEIPHAGMRSADGTTPVLTVSVGVASVRPATEQIRVDHLIALADQALYRAKATGRDRVAKASDCDPLGDDRTIPTTWQL